MSVPSATELHARFIDYLSQNRLMTIATSKENFVWAATVFYAYNDNLNLFFYSREDTRHADFLHHNPNVGVAINENPQPIKGEIKGIQIGGKANKVTHQYHEEYMSVFKARFSWAKDYPDHALFMVHPEEIWLIDSAWLGSDERVKVV